MKKILISVLVGMALISMATMQSCKKDDTTAPTMYLTGSSDITQPLPNTAGSGTWTDPGYSASDNEDGDITGNVTVTGTVNPNLKGTYTLSYAVSDKAGNAASGLSRTVHIINYGDALGGTYVNAHDSCQVTPPSTYDAVVTTSSISTSVNSCNFTIQNFGAFGTTVNIDGSLLGTALSFPSSQSLGAPASLTVASGTLTSASSPVRFTVTYTWTDGSSTEICNSVYTK